MRFGNVNKLVLFSMMAAACAVSASAQQIHFFPDFSSGFSSLQTNGSRQALYNDQDVLRLTNGQLGEPPSSTWFKIPQPVNSGFTTYFRFQIHNAAICCDPGDGLAFVIQNSSSTDASYGAHGAGLTAVGVGNGGLGYAGIPNSLAIEFDTAANAWDPTLNGSNHVAVQGCGLKTNGPVHTSGTYTIYHNNNVTSCLVGSSLDNNNSLPHLGVNCSGNSCADGTPHDVVIEYAPVNGVFMLTVWVDPTFITGTHTPTSSSPKAINIVYNIDSTQNPTNGLALAKDAKGNNTSAWVGFTAGQNYQPQQHDILAWEFTPHTPTQVQQTIPNGGMTATYSFGANDTQVTYFPSFVNQNGCDGKQQNTVVCLMTVLATPTDRNVFHQTRLVGTNFADEQCVLYQGTGGNCVVYSITCQNSNATTTNVQCPQSVAGTCNNIGDAGCIVFSTGYLTTDGITAVNADYLKADPIGTNNWITIFESFTPGTSDPRTTGTGNTPSDFVATFVPGGVRP